MSSELDKVRSQLVQDMDRLRLTLAEQVTTADLAAQERQGEEHAARVAKLQAALEEAVNAQRTAEAEASALRVKLASAEERANMLQARQEELRHERADLDG